MKVIHARLGVLACFALSCATEVDRELAAAETRVALQGADCFHYAERDITAGPEGYDLWGPTGISDRGDVYGLGLDCDDDFLVCTYDLIQLAASGEFSVVVSDFSPVEINRHGDAGGCVIDAAQNGQAAIAHPNGRVELLPRLPGELSSCIIQLSDNETALVVSVDENFVETVYVAQQHRTYPVPLTSAEVRDINDRGELAGVLETGSGDRAFRFEARSQTLMLLEPIEGDPNSWGVGIDNRGEVLGYSFVFSGVERIGKWNRSDAFEVYFVEGTPEFTSVTNVLVWNAKQLIVASDDSVNGKAYLFPKPGVRLDLADLTVSGTVPSRPIVYGINTRGDLLVQSVSTGTAHVFTRVN